MSKRDVSPEKQPRKQSKKPKKNSIVFSTEKQNKIKIKPKTAALCYASKKPIHTPILLRHLDVSRKKIKLIVRNRKSLIVHHPKTDRKQPEPLN